MKILHPDQKSHPTRKSQEDKEAVPEMVGSGTNYDTVEIKVVQPTGYQKLYVFFLVSTTRRTILRHNKINTFGHNTVNLKNIKKYFWIEMKLMCY